MLTYILNVFSSIGLIFILNIELFIATDAKLSSCSCSSPVLPFSKLSSFAFLVLTVASLDEEDRITSVVSVSTLLLCSLSLLLKLLSFSASWSYASSESIFSIYCEIYNRLNLQLLFELVLFSYVSFDLVSLALIFFHCLLITMSMNE